MSTTQETIRANAHATAPSPASAPPSLRVSRLWALAGVAAGVASMASIALSMALSPEYVEGRVMTPEILSQGLVEKQPILIGFHVATVASALLLVVFAAGLQRRLRAALPAHSLLPVVAFAGLLLVSVAQVLGSGLDTEFLFGTEDRMFNLAGDIGVYSHWIATIPWVWVGGGLAGLAVGVASGSRAVPLWLGVVGYALGGLTVLFGVSPLQYLAAGPGALWLLVTAIGFAAGDRALRRDGARG